jgi:hypothetical protein
MKFINRANFFTIGLFYLRLIGAPSTACPEIFLWIPACAGMTSGRQLAYSLHQLKSLIMKLIWVYCGI